MSSFRLKFALKRVGRRLGRRVVSGTRFWTSPLISIFEVLVSFGRFLVPFWRPLDFEGGPQIDHFGKTSETKLSFFEHVFCIDFPFIFGWVLVSFLMFF